MASKSSPRPWHPYQRSSLRCSEGRGNLFFFFFYPARKHKRGKAIGFVSLKLPDLQAIHFFFSVECFSHDAQEIYRGNRYFFTMSFFIQYFFSIFFFFLYYYVSALIDACKDEDFFYTMFLFTLFALFTNKISLLV